jgi:hypothetical protein
VTPLTPEITPIPLLTNLDECLAYLMGNVGAVENECACLSRDLGWTQQEFERAGKQVEVDMEALRTKHWDEIKLLWTVMERGSDERKGADLPVFNGN